MWNLFNKLISLPLTISPYKVGLIAQTCVLLLIFEEPPYYFSLISALIHMTTDSVQGFTFSTPSACVIAHLSVISHSYWGYVVPHGSCASLMACDVSHFFMCPLSFAMFSFEKYLLKSFAHVFNPVTFV